ncbi:hypothetical protein D3C75_932730 [compost metagenome]
MKPSRMLDLATELERTDPDAGIDARHHFAQLAELRQHLRAYDLAGPLTENRRAALGAILTAARALTEE